MRATPEAECAYRYALSPCHGSRLWGFDLAVDQAEMLELGAHRVVRDAERGRSVHLVLVAPAVRPAHQGLLDLHICGGKIEYRPVWQ